LSVGEGQRLTATAVLLCGHGSRDPEAIAEFELIAAALRGYLPHFDVAIGYLEFARPTIRDGLGALAERGARRIFAIPGMLLAASHVKRDLPREMNTFMADNPAVEIRLGGDLSIGPKLPRAAADRIAAVAQDPAIPPAETLLVVVGRGASDPDANSNIFEITQRLRDEMGFGWAEVAFTGVAQPRLDAVLTHSAPLGFRRIIVFPYFLLTGVLVKRIYAQADAAAGLFPGVEFVQALYLRDHPDVLGAFHDRVCELCDSDPAGPQRR
jgi:sirohydrochlorin cobaltochelatase